MFNSVILGICLIPLWLYVKMMRGYKFSTKDIVVIGIFAAMSYMLSLIPLVRYPQGGGINLFSFLPIMLVSLIYSKEAGMTTGLITGVISLMLGGYIIHPAQVILDYMLPDMALGLSHMFGSQSKSRIIAGCLIAVLLNTTLHFLSGGIYFGEFAPEGMGAWLYSFLYNFSGHGVEGILTVIVISFLPLRRLQSVAKGNHTSLKINSLRKT